MKTNVERENRWMVLEWDQQTVLGSCEPVTIVQGFLPGHEYVRVRLVFDVNNKFVKASLDRKSGWGHDRKEATCPLGEQEASVLLRSCGHRVINKLRYTLNQDNGVEESLDIYDGVLVPFGLVKFEREGSLDESLPLGIHDAVKVTNTVSDQQLAELCEEIQLGMWEGVGPEVLMEQILDPIRTTVITGPPGSGKTSVLKVLKTAMGHQIHFLDEVARMVITGCNCPVPIDFPSEMKRFERLVMSTQQTVHKFGLQRARLAGKKILVSDRFLDPVAYLGPGLNRGQKETILRVNIGYELSKIYQVIVLLLPDRETYERYQSQDDARSESYDEALLIQEWILDVYSSHPNLLTVNPVAEGQLDAKFDLVRRAIVGE